MYMRLCHQAVKLGARPIGITFSYQCPKGLTEISTDCNQQSMLAGIVNCTWPAIVVMLSYEGCGLQHINLLHLLEATGRNLNVYVIVGCVCGVVVGLFNLGMSED